MLSLSHSLLFLSLRSSWTEDPHTEVLSKLSLRSRCSHCSRLALTHSPSPYCAHQAIITLKATLTVLSLTHQALITLTLLSLHSPCSLCPHCAFLVIYHSALTVLSSFHFAITMLSLSHYALTVSSSFPWLTGNQLAFTVSSCIYCIITMLSHV